MGFFQNLLNDIDEEYETIERKSGRENGDKKWTPPNRNRRQIRTGTMSSQPKTLRQTPSPVKKPQQVPVSITLSAQSIGMDPETYDIFLGIMDDFWSIRSRGYYELSIGVYDPLPKGRKLIRLYVRLASDAIKDSLDSKDDESAKTVRAILHMRKRESSQKKNIWDYGGDLLFAYGTDGLIYNCRTFEIESQSAEKPSVQDVFQLLKKRYPDRDVRLEKRLIQIRFSPKQNKQSNTCK